MVLGFHLCFWNFHAEGNLLVSLLGSPRIANYFGRVSCFGWIGVEVFFVISGFIIAYSAEGATAFAFFRGRFTRLMPCVWVCSLLSLPFVYLIQKQPVMTIAKLFGKSITLYPRGPWIEGVLWTLVVEVSFYFFIFCLIYRDWFKYVSGAMAFIGSYSAAYWICRGIMLPTPQYESLAHKMGEISWSPLVQLSLVHYGCFFALGVGIWLQFVKRKPDRYMLLAPLLFVGCYFEIAYVNSTKVHDTGILQDVLHPFLAWLLSVAFIVISIVFNRQIESCLKNMAKGAPYFVKWLGRMTYPLYLLHLPVAFLVIYVLPSVFGEFIRWSLGVLAALVVSALVTGFIEPWAKDGTRRALNNVYERAITHRR